MIYTGKVMKDSSSCPTRRVRAAHPGNFNGLNQLAVTCAAAVEKENWTRLAALSHESVQRTVEISAASTN